jgi:hypothetical protein
MGTKIYLKIALYLLLQLCFFATTTFLIYITRNGNFINGANNFAIYIVSVITISAISIIKFKIIDSLLRMKIMLSIVFELLISFRILSVGLGLIYYDYIIPGSLLTRIINITCIAGFGVYMILIYKTYTSQVGLKPIKYLLLTVLYKVIEPIILFCFAFIFSFIFIFDDYINNDYFSDSELNLSILSAIGIIIFLFMYLRGKIILNIKRDEPEYSILEVIILFIGTIPIIQITPFIVGIVFLLH